MKTKKLIVKRVWTDNHKIYAETTDKKIASYDFSKWAKLANATAEQRNNFYLSYSGIHWQELDEDLSFEGMFCQAGFCSRTDTEDAVCYLS